MSFIIYANSRLTCLAISMETCFYLRIFGSVRDALSSPVYIPCPMLFRGCLAGWLYYADQLYTRNPILYHE